MTEQEWKLCGIPVVERAKEEVLLDVSKGIVPAEVASFSELHDYVDANYYGGAFEGDVDLNNDEAVYFWNRIQDEVDAWIKQGGVRLVAH